MAAAVSSPVPRGDVAASLNFYGALVADAAAAAPFFRVDADPGQPQRNFSDVTCDVLIRDVRGREADFTLDRDAFQVLRDVAPAPGPDPDFDDDAAVRARYYPDVERLLLAAVPGAERVHIFDHTVRRARPGAARRPVMRVHIDQTPASVAKRVRRYFPADADALVAARHRIINVWRPLNPGPVESFPLAFASSSSLADADVVAVEHRYPDGYLGETASIRHNPAQRWYYLSGMTARERLLLECFDSESLKPGSTIGGRVPHSAFDDPRTRPDAEGRESIEVRALVFGP